jgi:PAS domain S-box-containing protein
MAELEELYNNASCGYHSLDTLGLVVRMNDLELRWLGYHRDEVVGKMHVSQLLAPESLPIFHEHFPRIQAGLEIENVEVFFRRKDGTTFPALLSATAARDYSGRFLHSRTMVIDLSRIKRLEAEKDLANQQLQHGARLVSLGEMAAGMAHEINQPLAHIALTGQLIRGLQEAGRLTQDELLSLVDGMEASIARATRVINRVQLFGRRQAPELCSVDLNQTIRTALDLMSKQLRVEGIQVERDLSERLPRLLSDPHQLEQVWVNQITNARDALLEKAQTMGLAQTEVGPRRLVVRTRCAEEALWIEFENNGVGMSEETKQKLFQPFFTTKPPGRGTGLGLSISFSIMRGLGGTISVDSELGVGSRLTFRLPLAEVQP